MLLLPAFVEMSGYTWETGKQILDISVTLGSADKSSSCKVTLSDPMHIIASALINHSIKSGGILALPDTNKAPDITLPKVGTDNGKGEGTVSQGADYDAVTKAFLDTIVKREIPEAELLTRKGYYSANQLGTADITDADISAGGGFPASATGTNSNVGRYQLSRDEWDEAVKAGVIKRAFDPATQDAIAVYRLKAYDKGWKELRAGDIKSALRKASKEWVSIPGGSQANASATTKEYLDYYNKRLAFHQGTSGTSTAVAKQVEPGKPVAPPAAPTVTAAESLVIKGRLIRVNIGTFDFSFYHQGTEMNEGGTTTLTGQGIRWIMSRRIRSSTHKDITLKQLATKVAKSHRLSLDYQATLDPKYSHIDQSGISDYALLKRECEQSGLLITEEKNTIVIKERKQLGAIKLRLSRGDNLISYTIADKALTGNEPDVPATVDLPSANKSVIDPIAGKQVSTKKDIDRAGSVSNTTTGKTKATTAGKLVGADANASEVEKGKTKRIMGLPSTFVIPLSLVSLALTPLITVATENLSPVLDRVWIVKTVTHDLAKGTTTLQVNSAVTVVGSTNDLSIPKAVNEPNMGKGWVYPVSGTITSLWNPRRRHPLNGKVLPHKGTDIGAAIGTPVYAADSGTVTVNQFDSGGGGNYIRLQHANGYFTQYLHLRDPATPKLGTHVGQGEQIGFVGNTGLGTGAHLHFGMFKVNDAIHLNPGLVFKNMVSVGQVCVAKAPCESK